MDLNQFEEPAKKILNCENLLPYLQDNISVFNTDLITEYQKYVLPSLQYLQFSKTNAIESTAEVDIRVQKIDELEKRLKAGIGKLRKEFKNENKQCSVHNNKTTKQLSDRYMNAFLEKQFSQKDIEGDVSMDKAVIDEHTSNIKKINKFCDFTLISEIREKDGELDNSLLSGFQSANNVTNLLCEVAEDVNFLNDTKTLYGGVLKDATMNPFEEEIKDLKEIL